MLAMCRGPRIASGRSENYADIPNWLKEEQRSTTSKGGRIRITTAITERAGKVDMSRDTYRIVTRGTNGEIRIRDYDSQEALLKRHSQIGVDDCSTDLALRGLPVFRGLIGPMPEGKNVIRYESPEVFETLTKDWSSAKPARRRSRTQPQTLQLTELQP